MARFVAVLLVALGSLAVALDARGQDAKPEDLNRIIRVKPSNIAAKIGLGVHWKATWDEAVATSHATGKPIFWYLATIPQTIMDRKVEIDRYMLAGPFSWPSIIERINRDFVPVRTPPSREQVEQYNLKPYQFVEPGFLIVAQNQNVVARIDHVTTIHPVWFERLISQFSEREPRDELGQGDGRQELDAAWARFAEGDYAMEPPQVLAEDAWGAEKLLLAGMLAFRRGDQTGAKELWRQAAQRQPDSPTAWKAAAEAEGFGPFVRGFEVFGAIPDRAFRAGMDSIGSAAPSGTYDEPELWRRGVDFLLGMQRADGGVLDSDYDFGGFDSLPNVHCAVTALVGMALLESLPRQLEERREPIRSAVIRAADYVCDEQHINLQDRDEILWAQAYRVRLLSKMIRDKFGDTDRYRKELDRAIHGLEQIQLQRGGWQHEYANPFVTATALTALRAAQDAGAGVDTQKIERGLASLTRDRFASGAYPYSSRSEQQPGRDSIEASAGRIPVCELALWQWQKLTDRQLENAARVSLEHHKYLNVAYKYDNHTSTMAYGGFFFWYDMHARAETIAQIKDDAIRKSLAQQQRAIILELPELDGCFVDSHELGRCYGTAMALLSLAQLQ